MRLAPLFFCSILRFKLFFSFYFLVFFYFSNFHVVFSALAFFWEFSHFTLSTLVSINFSYILAFFCLFGTIFLTCYHNTQEDEYKCATKNMKTHQNCLSMRRRTTASKPLRVFKGRSFFIFWPTIFCRDIPSNCGQNQFTFFSSFQHVLNCLQFLNIALVFL